MSANPASFLAIDLGAGSGRGVIGTIKDGRLTLTQVHRFANEPVRIMDTLYWDPLRTHQEIKLAIAAARQEGPLRGIGVDSWGVDFGLLGRDGALLANPVHYRDARTDGAMEETFRSISRARIFEITGIQFMQFNTIYQLASMVKHRSQLLTVADRLLMIGELFTYFLTGELRSEFTNATTSQLYDPRAADWSQELLQSLDIPRTILPSVVAPGTPVGPLLPDIAEDTGAHGATVYLPAVHDTASAIAAVPLVGPDACYISSGTWSLLGIEVDEPIINEASLAANMTNEGGVGGKYAFLKNIMGMWLLQQCSQAWQRQGEAVDYGTLTQLAADSDPLVALIDPDHPDFFPPGDMPERIARYAQRTGQAIPQGMGPIVRCILDSLALRYNQVLTQIENLAGRRINVIHIVGGGSQNSLLNQLAADATGRTVVAGPVEATAAGNILVQATAAGVIDSISAGRAMVRASFRTQVFTPRHGLDWEAAALQFTEIQSKGWE